MPHLFWFYKAVNELGIRFLTVSGVERFLSTFTRAVVLSYVGATGVPSKIIARLRPNNFNHPKLPFKRT